MTVLHIVGGQSSGSVEDDQTYIQAMQALAESCVNPETKKPYIVSLKSGRQDSKEGNHKNFDLIFIFEFENTQDRDYFTDEDPVHKEFVSWVIKERGQLDFAVIDFTVGVW